MKKRQTKSSPLRKTLRVLLCICLLTAFLLLVGALAVYAWADKQIDREADETLFASLGDSQTTRIYANQAQYLSPKSRDTEQSNWAEYDFVYAGENSTWVDAFQISPHLLHAFVAIEDHRFYDHDGVDWLRTGKAVFNYLGKSQSRFGGSTITQQVVKNVCGERDLSAKRKAKEILRAIRLEEKYTKDEILTMYANIVPLANACTGVYAASQFYFGKNPDQLTLAECASIAAITNSPSRYNPLTHPEQNKKRAQLILGEMKKYGYISEEMYTDAMEAEIRLKEGIRQSKSMYHDWFVETLLEDVINDLVAKKNMSRASATRLVYGGGLQIMSTVNPTLQNQVSQYFADKKHFYPYAEEDTPDFALVMIDPHTGHLLATAGGTGEKNANRIQNGIFTKHSPGSSLKPIALYMPALEQKRVHWGTAFEDMPEILQQGEKVTIWPKNSPDVYQGRISLADALAYSKNTVAVQLYHMLGKENIYRHLSDVGINNLIRNKQGNTDLAPAPLALGQLTEGVSLRQLADAYTPLCDQGIYRQSNSYLYVLDAKGNMLLDGQGEEKQICSPETAFLMTKMLQGVTDYGTARRMGLKYTVDVAGKTGTSGGDKDRWFVGYTPEYLCAVRSSASKRNAIGDKARSPLYIWDDCMKAVYRISENYIDTFPQPKEILYSAYCSDSGEVPTDLCMIDMRGPRLAYGYFTPDNMPATHCRLHKSAWRNPFDEEIVTDSPSFPFFQPISVLNTEKKDIEDSIKTIDRPYRLWHHIENEAKRRETENTTQRDNVGFMQYIRRFLGDKEKSS